MRKFISIVASITLIISSLSSTAIFAVSNENYDATVSNGSVVALQNAFDNAKKYGTAKSPYTIHVTKSINVKKALSMYSNTKLVADKGVKFVRNIGRKSDTYMIRFGAPNSNASGYKYKNITIDGGTWDGNGKKGDTPFVMFKLAHAENITLSNCTFQKDVGKHMVEAAAINGMKVYKCTFKNHISNTSSYENQEALQLDVNLKNTTKMGNYDKYQNKNFTVEKCTFDNVGRGVGSHNSIEGVYFTKMNIINNTFNNLKSYAIDLINYRNSKIQKNKINNCVAGIYFINVKSDHQNSAVVPSWNLKLNTKKDNSIISDNTVITKTSNNKNARCLLVRGENIKKKIGNSYLKGDHRVYGLTIKNNTFKTAYTSAVQLIGAKKCSFANNKLYYTGKKSNKENYIALYADETSDETSMCNNEINKFKTGIACKNSKKLKVENNTILNSVSQGIYFEKSNGTVKNCKIQNVEINHGIALIGKSKLTVSKCTIKKCKQWGIAIISGSAAVKNCKFSGNKKGNIYRA
ncbi:MAG: right-handed parallel beta-helix repeat-containing protein [Ruminococcus sp.]|nr:right-handed parallel beta-helix repeat-containing protein [Ruminococcus sp.]